MTDSFRSKLGNFKYLPFPIYPALEEAGSFKQTENKPEIDWDVAAEEFLSFVEFYKTKSLIDYSKIEYSNNHLLDKQNTTF